jgi:hypothetical protein
LAVERICWVSDPERDDTTDEESESIVMGSFWTACPDTWRGLCIVFALSATESLSVDKNSKSNGSHIRGSSCSSVWFIQAGLATSVSTAGGGRLHSSQRNNNRRGLSFDSFFLFVYGFTTQRIDKKSRK